jgi:predicted MFS family arabinose efflux permease
MTLTPRVATFLIFVVDGAAVGTWVAAIPGIKAELGATDTEMGLVLFAASLGALISQQVTGQLLVRVSSRRMVLATGLVLPFLIVLPMLAPSVATLAAAMILFGAVNTSVDVSMNAHGVALETNSGRSILSGLHAGWSLGGVIGAVGVGIAIALGIAVAIEALLAGLLLLLLVILASRSLGQGSVRTEGASGIHLPPRSILPIALLVILLAFVEGGLTDWGGIYLREGIDASAELAAFAYAAFSLGLFLARLVGDRIKDAVGSIRLIQGGMLLTAAAIAVFLVLGQPIVALLGLAVAGAGIANAIPQLFGAAARIPPNGPSLSAAFTFLTLTFMVGPPLIGVTSDAVGISAAMGLFVVASIVAAAVVSRVPSAETNPRVATDRAAHLPEAGAAD